MKMADRTPVLSTPFLLSTEAKLKSVFTTEDTENTEVNLQNHVTPNCIRFSLTKRLLFNLFCVLCSFASLHSVFCGYISCLGTVPFLTKMPILTLE